ncbi:MAG TPA: hypothetical protein VN864_06490, partial [Thermoplasmata archaeon]|nr:hypothetical protein [Thermoplasmata archaeon]
MEPSARRQAGLGIAQTLVTFNNSLLPGNFLAQNGLGPHGAAFDSANGRLFVPDVQSNTVSIVSFGAGELLANVPVGSSPEAALYVPTVGEIFVANSVGDTVSVINDTND